MTVQNLYQNQFDKKHNFPSGAEHKKTLIIASTPRCGSHFLGHALFDTKHFGFPLEYANPINLKKWGEIYSVDDFDEIMRLLIQNRTSSNGVFAIKVHYSHIQQFGNFARLSKYFVNPTFVHLSRKNLAKQAISLAMARQSGVWIDGQEPKNEDVKYDAQEIDFCLKRTIMHNASWNYLFAKSGLDCVNLKFEDITQDLGGTINELSRKMGESFEISNAKTISTTRQQSSALNQEWLDKYRNYQKDSDIFNDIQIFLDGKSKFKGLRELLRAKRI